MRPPAPPTSVKPHGTPEGEGKAAPPKATEDMLLGGGSPMPAATLVGLGLGLGLVFWLGFEFGFELG